MVFDKRDIVFVEKFDYPNGQPGLKHYFVIIDANDDELEVIPLEYLSMIISSQAHKNNDANENYPYNEPIYPNSDNGLLKAGHVKTNEIIILKAENISRKIGTVTEEEYNTYLRLFLKSMK